MENNIMLVFTCFNFFILFAQSDILPFYVPICKRNNPDFNGCLLNSANKLRPYLGKGIPEMGLIPVEPLKIRNLFSHVGGSDINLDLQIIDAIVYNLSNFTMSNLDVKLETGSSV
ncbi:hypothetical protein FQR65_LT03772 [Abscondita terminalis]|nr:hypothetical protein FQR65_LT03772 [Abscondita terminalis]